MQTKTICDLISFGVMLADNKKMTDETVIKAIDAIIRTMDRCDVGDVHQHVLVLKSTIEIKHMLEP